MKYHVPTGFGFSPKASGFYPFGDATDLASEGGGGDVVWLIQASASNHKPKGRFFWFVYAKGIPKEPSLWFEKKSRRDLMCVGRYAAKVMRNERSEMEHNRSEMPANIA